jgi:amino acid transporter/nucleotide-binding universal stress UspA family protein
VVKDILSRDLGLFSVIAISTGTMVGAGIFILPGIATGMAGPAVTLAFIIAGLIALTAALTVSELATAMPAAGGAYVFISRSLGPLMGSVAGWGVWFSLMVKGSFALVGLSAYLVIIVALPFPVVFVSLALCIILLVINVLGAKVTGGFQTIIIALVLSALAIYIALGLPQLDFSHYEPFAPSGMGGILAAAGLVFVSYIGVTKIASVAEEVKNPEKNIPRGIIISLLLMMVIYAFVTFVMVGTLPINLLETSYTPISDSAEVFLGAVGGITIAIIAVIALISMANAAILTTTRYPFAMSRDQLMPKWLLKIHGRFSTPHNSIILTGTVMLVLIAFVDVVSLAKLASVFTIVIFMLMHIALVIFRFTKAADYSPSFKSPGFPVIQVLGVGASLFLIVQMGLIPIVATALLFSFGCMWFFIYGVKRVSFSGAFREALTYTREMRVRHAESATMDEKPIKILVPLSKLKHEGDLLTLASWIAAERNALVQVVQIKEVPSQTPFEVVKGLIKGAESEFEQRTLELAQKIKVKVETYEILSHDWKKSVVNFAESQEVDLILLDWEEEFHHELVRGSDVDWIMDHAPCDVTVFKDRGITELNDILLTTTSEVYDNIKVRMANSIGLAVDAKVTFFQVMDPHASPMKKRSARRYHDILKRNCACKSSSIIIEGREIEDEILKEAKKHNLLIIGSSTHTSLRDVIWGHIDDRVIKKVDCSVLITKYWVGKN